MFHFNIKWEEKIFCSVMPEKMSYGLRSSPIPDISINPHMIQQWQMSLKVMTKEAS